MFKKRKPGFVLSLEAVVFMAVGFILLGLGAYYGVEMGANQRIDMIRMQGDAIDSALQEYAQMHKAVSRDPASQYSTREAADSRLRVMRDKQDRDVLSYGFAPEFPLGIKPTGMLQNQRSESGGADDVGLDFGYFHQKIEFCKENEIPGPNNLNKWMYIPIDQYGNRIKTGNTRSSDFPATQYALVVAIKGGWGKTLYYQSDGSYRHEQITQSQPEILRQ